MMTALLVANALMFIALAGAFVAIAALARQVGVLFERVAPAGALTLHPPKGLQVGDLLPSLELEALTGRPLAVGGPRPNGRALLLLFVGPDCPICRELTPTFRSFAKAEAAWLDVVFASDGGTPPQHLAYARSQGLEPDSYVLSQPLGLALQVAKIPYGALVDGDGVLRARGLINTREHLESLVQAVQLGFGSVQEFVTATGGGRDD